MASYDIRPLQLHILKILQAVDKVCQEHNLRYYLWAGTMLGAVRHKGFIPWDDDMDIAMPRKDYDTLMAHAHEWLPKPFEAVCAETDPNYPGPFGKIQDASTTLIEREHINYIGGLYIDVFPLDGVCANKLLQRLNFARYEFWKRVIYYIHRDPFKHGKDLSAVVPLLCQKLFTNHYVQQKMRRIMMHYDYDKCDLIADYDDGKNGICKRRHTVFFHWRYLPILQRYTFCSSNGLASSFTISSQLSMLLIRLVTLATVFTPASGSPFSIP
jgi:lipopolysaccharide cholinephosphotransferase